MVILTNTPKCYCSTCVAARRPSLWDRIKSAALRLARKGRKP